MIFPALLPAQNNFRPADNPQTEIEKLEEISKNTETVKSRFVQYKQLSVLENTIESRGIFMFKKPGKVRWEYQSPYPYLILMNKGRMTVKEEGKVQEFDTESNRMFKEINDLMLSMLSGEILNNPHFDTEIKENSEQILAVLTPRKKELKQMMQSIEMYFNKNTYVITEIKIPEASGDYTRIVFKNRQNNIPLSESEFILQ